MYSNIFGCFITLHHTICQNRFQVRYGKFFPKFVVPDLEEDGVSPEELELVHLGHGESHHGVVIIDRVLDNQTVGSLLLV